MWKEWSSLPWDVPGEPCVHPALQKQVETGCTVLTSYLFLLRWTCHYTVIFYLWFKIINYAVFSFDRWQPRVWRVGNIVQTQQRVWVFNGVGCCHGDHSTRCPSLKSITVELIYLYDFKATTALPDSQPRAPCFLVNQRHLHSCTVKRTHTVTSGWCTHWHFSFQNEISHKWQKCRGKL